MREEEEPFHYNQKKSLAQADPVSDEPEKVSVPQTPIVGGHTTFYAQQQ